MTEPSTARSPRTLVAALAVLVVAVVLDRVFFLGLLETGLVLLALLPPLAVVAVPVLFYGWARRRGDL